MDYSNGNGTPDNENSQNQPNNPQPPYDSNAYTPPNNQPYPPNTPPAYPPQAPYGQPVYGGAPNTGGEIPPSGGKGTTGLVLAILGIVLCIVGTVVMSAGIAGMMLAGYAATVWVGVGLCVVSVVMTIVGTVMGVGARKKAHPDKRGVATAAMVVGIIGIIFTVIMTVACGCVVCAGIAAYNSGDYGYNSFWDAYNSLG